MSETDWDSAVARSDDNGRATAVAVRELVRRLHPEVIEVVWPHQGTVGWGVGPKKMSEHYAYLTIHAAHVNLGFYRGASLPDPEGLLGGSGKQMRSMRLSAPLDLDNAAVAELLRAARVEREEALRS